MLFPSDHGFTTAPIMPLVHADDTFRLSSAEGLTDPLVPYEMRVVRPYRYFGYWEVVFESGGHPARHGSITVMPESEILRLMNAA